MGPCFVSGISMVYSTLNWGSILRAHGLDPSKGSWARYWQGSPTRTIRASCGRVYWSLFSISEDAVPEGSETSSKENSGLLLGGPGYL